MCYISTGLDSIGVARVSNNMQTETIDKLFLELSQVTRATTKRERDLENHLCAVQLERDLFREAVFGLVQRWHKIADERGDELSAMTANVHRLFANELNCVLVKKGWLE